MDFKEIFGSNKPRCQHFYEDGSRCKADPQTGKKFCFMHDPEQKEKQAEARKKGGEARFQPYEPKLPEGFEANYRPPENENEVNALLDQITLYFIQGEMDLRSARFLVFVLNTKLATWNTLDRRQYRTVRSAEQQARILAREKDPWSSGYRALAKATKAREEAAKSANNNRTPQYPLAPAIAAAVDHGHNRNDGQDNDEGPWQPPLRSGSPVTGTRTIERNPVRREEEAKPQALPLRRAPEAKRNHAADLQNEDSNQQAPPKRPPQPAEQQQNAELTPQERLALHQRYKNRKY